MLKLPQNALIPGRLILEGVMIVHEELHELRCRENTGVVLKLDFEKAYEKVS